MSDQPYISTFASTVKRNNPSVIPLLSIWPPKRRGLLVKMCGTKVAYAKKKELLGYNVWQIPNDYNWEFSKATNSELKGSSKDQEKLILTDHGWSLLARTQLS
ncbi:hypothetical protein OSB04_015167 [Centaurea solstitialis]|uniref:Uncharacterized protein n=1 Tax=Centaurea solstitialis TaxID=347529 RepID=A0AA38W767_9ASTR|nr:hypothetical protein OSB04_015167 [Centaurea solstitialis]